MIAASENPGNVRLSDEEAINRLVAEQHRRGDKSAAKTLTKLVIETLPKVDRQRTSPQSSQENHGRADRDMKPAPTGSDPRASTPPSGDAHSQGDVTDGSGAQGSAISNHESSPTTGKDSHH